MIGVRACLVIVCIFTLAERIPAAQSNPAADQEKPNSEREQIGESLGKPVYRDQLEAQPGSSTKQELHRLFLSQVVKRYREQHRAAWAPTLEEIAFAARHFDAEHRKRIQQRSPQLHERIKQIQDQLDSNSPLADEILKLNHEKSLLERELAPPGSSFAAWMLENWKFQRHLYEKFGRGRVLFQQAGIEAFDATRRWLESMEEAGDFRIDDESLRKQLYEYWTTQDHGAFLSNKPQTIDAFLNPKWVEQKPTLKTVK